VFNATWRAEFIYQKVVEIDMKFWYFSFSIVQKCLKNGVKAYRSTVYEVKWENPGLPKKCPAA